MNASDIFLLVVRWLHLISAAAWIGGGLFYLLILGPALRKNAEAGRIVNSVAAADFRVLVDTCIFVLLATGVVLTFNRLTPGIIGVPYAITLAVKIALSVWMFMLARGRRRRTALMNAYREPDIPAVAAWQKTARAVSGYNTVLILGIVVFLLADLLKVLFEIALEDEITRLVQ